jgi:thioredoxin 1
MERRDEIENLLDLEDAEIKQLWMSWDKGDCSEIGLVEILLCQLIKEHKTQNGLFYDTDYDNIKLRYELNNKIKNKEMALEFTDKTAKDLIETGDLVVIDFHAIWCSPCKMVGPMVEKMAEKYADHVVIGKIDIDNNEELASTYGVRNIPTILFFKNGELVDKQVGATQETKLEEKIENLINS